jgi:hypothetical protein
LQASQWHACHMTPDTWVSADIVSVSGSHGFRLLNSFGLSFNNERVSFEHGCKQTCTTNVRLWCRECADSMYSWLACVSPHVIRAYYIVAGRSASVLNIPAANAADFIQLMRSWLVRWQCLMLMHLRLFLSIGAGHEITRHAVILTYVRVFAAMHGLY